MPEDYYVRNCQQSELEIWKAIHFDDASAAEKYHDYMTSFFGDVYADFGNLFFKKCLFVCDKNDLPVGTCFIWRAYNKINTVHWFKVVREYEGKGIGRALLTAVMQGLKEEDYPVYLHTQPSSFRAIKLYSDFGFSLLSDPVIGNRQNDLEESMPILQKYMPAEDYMKLRITRAPENFLEAVLSSEITQF
jgi:GNAT superfamily N-acetyltransferase